MKHSARVENSKIVLTNKAQFTAEIVKLEGKKISIEIKEVKNDRSLKQNAYYWGIVIEILSHHLGYTPDEMHDILKWKFLPKEIDFKGERILSSFSTADLTTKEFESLMDKIRSWASFELETWIPEPNESEFNY